MLALPASLPFCVVASLCGESVQAEVELGRAAEVGRRRGAQREVYITSLLYLEG